MKRLSYEDSVRALNPMGTAEAGGAGGAGQAQMRGSGSEGAGAGRIRQFAEQGVTGSGGRLPHLARIQTSFGRHDVSEVKAHVGGAATQANEAIGSQAYATGDRVAFKESPDLFTAAHEAAHVVQQRSGVQLRDGVGQAGDEYERHADAVASRVVTGRSAADLLGGASRHSPVGRSSDQLQGFSVRAGPVQFILRPRATPRDGWDVQIRMLDISQQTGCPPPSADAPAMCRPGPRVPQRNLFERQLRLGLARVMVSHRSGRERFIEEALANSQEEVSREFSVLLRALRAGWNPERDATITLNLRLLENEAGVARQFTITIVDPVEVTMGPETVEGTAPDAPDELPGGGGMSEGPDQPDTVGRVLNWINVGARGVGALGTVTGVGLLTGVGCVATSIVAPIAGLYSIGSIHRDAERVGYANAYCATLMAYLDTPHGQDPRPRYVGRQSPSARAGARDAIAYMRGMRNGGRGDRQNYLRVMRLLADLRQEDPGQQVPTRLFNTVLGEGNRFTTGGGATLDSPEGAERD